jgi:DNA-binding NarL/FixJ family response regulator
MSRRAKGMNDARGGEATARPSLRAPCGLQANLLEDGGALVLFTWPGPPSDDATLATLTPAEHEVVQLVREGLSNGEIAVRRRRSPRTIANQLASAFEKLGVRSRIELFTLATCMTRMRSRAAVEPGSGPLRRLSSEEAIALWAGLFDGGWSSVERGVDGRTLVARRNTPETKALAQRERDVLSLAARGHSNKQIGYLLGLAASTVATYLAAALPKLGLQCRREAIELFGGSVRCGPEEVVGEPAPLRHRRGVLEEGRVIAPVAELDLGHHGERGQRHGDAGDRRGRQRAAASATSAVPHATATPMPISGR